MGVREEDVAVRRGAHQPRLLEALGVDIHLETLRRNRPRTLGARHQAGTVVDRLIRLRVRQIGECNLAANAWMLLGVVGKRGLAGDGGARLGK